MRIAIDISIQDTPYLTGVERVQRSILRELTRLDREHEYLLVSRRPVTLPFDLPDNFRLVELSAQNPSYLWRETLLPPLFRKEKVDAFHSPVSAIPVIGKLPKCATVHELPWVERKPNEPVRSGHRVWLFLNTRYAQRIIAVSHRTKENIVALYPKAADKVAVIHHGVDERFTDEFSGPDRASFLEGYGIPDRPYLLFVGTLRRKKNLRAFLDAFAALPPQARGDTQLILAGVRNVSFHDLQRKVDELGLHEDVWFPGYVSDDALVPFYHHATALVYPSLFEGFGLPPLEAMACGTPVLTTEGGAIPEVVGDAALLTDPRNTPAFTAQLERLLTDQACVDDLRARGFERVKQFTWRKTALAHLDVWQSMGEMGAATTP